MAAARGPESGLVNNIISCLAQQKKVQLNQGDIENIVRKYRDAKSGKDPLRVHKGKLATAINEANIAGLSDVKSEDITSALEAVTSEDRVAADVEHGAE